MNDQKMKSMPNASGAPSGALAVLAGRKPPKAPVVPKPAMTRKMK